MSVMLLTLIKNHAAAFGMLLAGITVGCTISVQHRELVYIKAELASARAETIAVTASNQRLVKAIGEQNNYVLALKAASAARAEHAVQQLAAAKTQMAERLRKTAALTRNAGGGTDCQNAHQLLARYFGAKR